MELEGERWSRRCKWIFKLSIRPLNKIKLLERTRELYKRGRTVVMDVRKVGNIFYI